MEKNIDQSEPGEGLGCRFILIVILACFIAAGIIFFAGRMFLGDEGTYYLFYFTLGLMIIGIVIYQLLINKNRRS